MTDLARAVACDSLFSQSSTSSGIAKCSAMNAFPLNSFRVAPKSRKLPIRSPIRFHSRISDRDIDKGQLSTSCWNRLKPTTKVQIYPRRSRCSANNSVTTVSISGSDGDSEEENERVENKQSPAIDRGDEAQSKVDGEKSHTDSTKESNTTPIAAIIKAEKKAGKFMLLLGSTWAKTDAHFLQKRKRNRWWKRGENHKVPTDKIEDVREAGEYPVALWKKLLPLGVIFFCASFNLTILQNVKDSLIYTAVGGREMVPFLGTWMALPITVLYFFFYNLITERLPSKATFYAAVTPLLAFFAFFAVVLFPAHTFLHPQGLADSLAGTVPIGLMGLVRVVENWTFSLFFCVAELWGTVVISIGFWTLANEVCSVEEAKSVYPLLGISANLALIVAGNYIKWVNQALSSASLHTSMLQLVGSVLAGSMVMMAAKRFVDQAGWVVENSAASAKKPKAKGSFWDQISILRQTRRIRNLTVLVIGYGVSHRLFEFAWKGQLTLLHPNPLEYQAVLSNVSIAIGSLSIMLMLTGRVIFQRLGWGCAALATPVCVMLMGGTFFGLSLLGMAPDASKVIATAAVFAGAVTQVFIRSSKYSLFDPAKEMVYIEMPKDQKAKGKAAVDMVGSQIGKSGALWMTQFLIFALGSVTAALPFISCMFGGIIVLWLRAVLDLNQCINEDKDKKAQPSGSDLSDDTVVATAAA